MRRFFPLAITISKAERSLCQKQFANCFKVPALIKITLVRLSLLTMTKLNHMREMPLFVCSKMAD